MEQYKLGDCGLPITRIGLGLAALGRPGYINLGHSLDLAGNYAIDAMQARTHGVLDAAWQAGVRYFDAARSYGRAEAFLGTWLQTRQIDPGSVTVGSKWGYTYTANWQVQTDTHEVKEHSLTVLQRQWQESQMHLGNYLKLYQIHSATLESGVLDNQAVLKGLAGLKQDGLAIGLSVSGAHQEEILQHAVEIAVDGIRLFDAVQVTWNLFEPAATPALHSAHMAGIGIIVKEALANGRLTNRNNDLADAERLSQLALQAKRLNTSLDALALAAVLAQPWADVVLSGAATPEHLLANIQALTVAWDEEAAAVAARCAETPDIYWKKRQELAWN